jgi:16S rRNA pseudouridine516 synthase
MFAAVGNHVEALHRSRIGGLALGDLAPGMWRALDEDDKQRLFAGAV